MVTHTMLILWSESLFFYVSLMTLCLLGEGNRRSEELYCFILDVSIQGVCDRLVVPISFTRVLELG